MSKKKSKSKKTKKVVAVNNDKKGQQSIIAWLTSLAHEGTEEAIKKIEEFLKTEKDKNLIGFAKCALDEAQFFCYSPNNELEEEDFELAKMIFQKEDRIFDLEMKLGKLQEELMKEVIEKKVWEKVMKNNHKGKTKDWEYYYSPDFYCSEHNRLAEIQDSINYDSAWVEEARKLIKNKKFINIPKDFFNHIHSDYDGVNIWDDDGCGCNDFYNNCNSDDEMNFEPPF